MFLSRRLLVVEKDMFISLSHDMRTHDTQALC